MSAVSVTFPDYRHYVTGLVERRGLSGSVHARAYCAPDKSPAVDKASAMPPTDRTMTHMSALDQLRRAQDDVVRRGQLATAGWSRSAVQAQLSAERWQAIGAVVIVLHNGPLTPQQYRWVAVLNAGQHAVLAGRTAAAAGGLVGWEGGAEEVLVPKGTSVPELSAVSCVVHESRRLAPGDTHPVARPPRTRIERALVDAASWSASPRTACGLLAAGVQQRLTTAGRLLETLQAAGRLQHRRVMATALQDIAGGAQALSEIDFGRLCRRHGLPPPTRQQVRTDSSGRRRYLDATIVGPDGEVVHAEVDGALHLRVRTYWDDMDRGNELVIAGERVLRFGSIAMYLDEYRVADQLRRCLAARPARRLVRV